jgi:hypothetical protein
LTTLFSFGSTVRVSRLLLAKDGNFYCTSLAVLVGESVLKMTPNGKFMQFHLFDRASRVNALNGLVQGRDGNFYGTCGSGPSTNLGMVFRLTPDGTATELAYFNGANGIFRLVFLPTLGIAKTAQSVIFAWDAFPGKSYQVQYKSDLNLPNWSDLSPALTATNGTVSVTNDATGAAQRFYRVALPR